MKEKLFKTGLPVLMIFALVLTAACGSDSGASEPPAEEPPSTSVPAPAEKLSEWEKIVAAAKEEGKIVISGDPSEAWRTSLVNAFQEAYPEIEVEYTGINGRDFWPRVTQERELGQYLWDLRTGGVETLAYAAKNAGYLQEIRPLLNAEIADDSKWIGGLDGLFMDKEKAYMPGYTMYIAPTTFVNRDYIPESELATTEQLLDPKFKDKIVIQNPRGGASFSALSNLGFAYGEDFLKELMEKQNVVTTDDKRQQAEWVIRGRYPIAIGFNDTQLIPFVEQGLGKNVEPVTDKTIPVATGLGAISLLKDAPHPNAAIVYIHWLLSQETQKKLTENVLLNSKRTDVPPVLPDLAVDQAKLDQYRQYSTEENVEISNKIMEVIK